MAEMLGELRARRAVCGQRPKGSSKLHRCHGCFAACNKLLNHTGPHDCCFTHECQARCNYCAAEAARPGPAALLPLDASQTVRAAPRYHRRMSRV